MITSKNKAFLARYGSSAHVDELMKKPDNVFGSNPVLDKLVNNYNHKLTDEQLHRFPSNPNCYVRHEAKITISSRKNK